MAKSKKERLSKLEDELQSMEASPLYEYRQNHNYEPVLGEGNPHAELLFVGEAPGRQEARTGRPFVGAAGRVLDELLADVGLERDDVYITNVVKDRPPENRDPTQEEIDFYSPLLEKQIAIIEPAVIATLGRFAMTFILQKYDRPEAKRKISDVHGKALPARAPYGKITVIPLFHPAVALYNRSQRPVLEKDMEVVKQHLPS
jgi:DNA polymerase